MSDRVLTCGSDRIALWNSQDWSLERAWLPAELPGLSDEERGWVRWYVGSSDEAQVDLHRPDTFLLTCVSGLVARQAIDGADCTVLAWEPGAHSVCSLPGGLVAVAVSDSPGALAPGLPEPQHSSVPIYLADGSRSLCSRLTVGDAHGVLWDTTRERLWVLGGRELLSCILQDDRSLHIDGRWALPDHHGHALAAGDGDALLLSTGIGAWRFDPVSGAFTAIAALQERPNVKGLSRHPIDGRLLHTHPAQGSHYGVTCCDEQELPIVDAVYKARWLPARS